LYRQVGDQAGLANVSITLARLAAAQGDFAAAAERLQPAIDFGRRIDHPLTDDLLTEQTVWRRRAEGTA
jgi:hypothetical protein